jgi:hypothetical protein
MSMSVSILKFGKDHWSTFAYAETRAVDHEGVLDPRHMRCDQDRHPQFVHLRGSTPPTRLAGDELLTDHDDWDCLDDCERACLIKNVGTGLARIYELTPFGHTVASELRTHRQKGGNYSTFRQ